MLCSLTVWCFRTICCWDGITCIDQTLPDDDFDFTPTHLPALGVRAGGWKQVIGSLATLNGEGRESNSNLSEARGSTLWPRVRTRSVSSGPCVCRVSVAGTLPAASLGPISWNGSISLYFCELGGYDALQYHIGRLLDHVAFKVSQSFEDRIKISTCRQVHRSGSECVISVRMGATDRLIILIEVHDVISWIIGRPVTETDLTYRGMETRSTRPR